MNRLALADQLRTIRKTEAVPVVYFVSWEGGPIKIGWTVNLSHRLHQLQAGLPFDIILMAKRGGPRELEKFYHRHFEPWWMRGEWFERNYLLLREIGKLNGAVAGRPMLFPPRGSNRVP